MNVLVCWGTSERGGFTSLPAAAWVARSLFFECNTVVDGEKNSASRSRNPASVEESSIEQT